jgi:hypothetical protein
MELERVTGSLAALSLVLLTMCVAARADDAEFDLSGGLSGTFTINENTGAVTSADVEGETNFSYGGIAGNLTEIQINPRPNGALADFGILFPVSNLIGYSGGALCSLSSPCDYTNIPGVGPNYWTSYLPGGGSLGSGAAVEVGNVPNYLYVQ